MQRTDTFTTTDGLKLHTVHWLPDDDPRAVILLVHGVGEHSARYAHVAAHLTQAGYAVYAYDQRGHGQSDGLRAHYDTFHHAIADLEQYYTYIKSAHPDTPIFVLGHSMGSVISHLFTHKHQDKLAGWVSSGTPLLLEDENPAPVVFIGRLLNRIVPRLHLFKIEPATLSRDPDVVSDYENDPLVSHKPTRLSIVNGIIQSSRQMRRELPNLRLPILLLHGGADSVTPASGSRYIYDHAGSDDKTIHIYEGLYHEIFNEPERETVLNNLTNWLDAQTN